MIFSSCTALSDDLDSPIAGRRSHEHTATAMELASLDHLWDNYGIVGDLVVCTYIQYTNG
jgi:hypothetical protein